MFYTIVLKFLYNGDVILFIRLRKKEEEPKKEPEEKRITVDKTKIKNIKKDTLSLALPLLLRQWCT